MNDETYKAQAETNPPTPRQDSKQEKKHKNEVLDDAIDDSFPASDPPSITQPKPGGEATGNKRPN